MKLKRALWIGVVVYVLSFIIGLLTTIIMKIDISNAVEVPTSVWVMGIIVSVAILGYFTGFYFRDKEIKATWKEGLKFGIVVIVIGTILDSIFIIPYILSTGSIEVLKYYANPLFLLTLIILLGTATGMGWYKGKK